MFLIITLILYYNVPAFQEISSLPYLGLILDIVGITGIIWLFGWKYDSEKERLETKIEYLRKKIDDYFGEKVYKQYTHLLNSKTNRSAYIVNIGISNGKTMFLVSERKSYITREELCKEYSFLDLKESPDYTGEFDPPDED